MPTRKSSKKAQKSSGRKGAKREEPKRRVTATAQVGAKKSASSKAGAKKAGKKRGAAKRGAASAKSSKKAAAKHDVRLTGSRKTAGRGGKEAAVSRAGVTRPSARRGPRAAAAAAEAFIGNCLGLTEAGAIVENAIVLTGGISPSQFDIDRKLERMGIISTNQCAVVTSRILQDVRAFPCTINDTAAACTPDMTARALIDSVQSNAGRP